MMSGKKKRVLTGLHDPLNVVNAATRRRNKGKRTVSVPTQDRLHAGDGAAEISIQNEKISPETLLDKRNGTRGSPSICLGKIFPDTQTRLAAKLDELRSKRDAVGIATNKRQADDAIILATLERKLVEVKKKLKREKVHFEALLLRGASKTSWLECSLETPRKDLDIARQKTLCWKCMDSQKDAICYPCQHLGYCTKCLDRRREENNFCPTCREPILAVVQCIT